MNRYLCIHGHFYQPPRENPWLEQIERQDSAHPYHDWNERIAAECYATNAAARILDAEGNIATIVNNYSRISFNFGPTLLSWMEAHRPDAYAGILEADRLAVQRFGGHGSAVAQVYNHMIMPLANARDKKTQIRWGLEDFRRRFSRESEGIWLAETAVDIETLELLVDHGLKYTLLAPRQASRIRKTGETLWHNVNDSRIDPRRAYRCRLPSGRSIAIFFYDGPIAQDIAFAGLLGDGGRFAERLASTFPKDWYDESPLVHVATDGESYGHHSRFGEMALAYCLETIEAREMAQLTVYGQFLELAPPQWEVEIHENSSWSCAHGVERWKSDCGCCAGGHYGWNQKWRGPLRHALNYVRDRLAPEFESACKGIFEDPWDVRDRYIEVILDRSAENVDIFLERESGRTLDAEEKVRALKALEMQRQCQLMFTSCGWFFDEVSGIETVQILQYAARALQLARDISDHNFEPEFLRHLDEAPSNIPELRTAAIVYEKYVLPARSDMLRVAAHYASGSVFRSDPANAHLYCYTAESLAHSVQSLGKQRLATGRVRLRSKITTEEQTFMYAAMHLGDHNLNAGVSYANSGEAYTAMRREVAEAFESADVIRTVRAMDSHFGRQMFSIWSLFRDEQIEVLNNVLRPTFDEMDMGLRRIYSSHAHLMKAMLDAHIPTPPAFTAAAEILINADLQRALRNDPPDLDALDALKEQVERWKPALDKATLDYLVRSNIEKMVGDITAGPSDATSLDGLARLLAAVRALGLHPDLWRAQNICFQWVARLRGQGGDIGTSGVGASIARLGQLLGVK
jgi:alpha-amylase/alpha-mannosidase (GH57 family)